MRIGIDARLWNETGVGRYIRNLVLNLQIIDGTNEYVLFVRSKDVTNNSFDFAQEQKLKWKIVETDIHWHSVEEQLKFPNILYKENVDLMHFPYFSLPIFYNKPFVVTVHDLILNHFPTGKASTLPYPLYLLKRIGYDAVMRHGIKKSKKIIVPLHVVKEDVVTTFGVSEKKVAVTYEGVDVSSLRAKRSNLIKNRIAASPSAPRNDGYFLYVGNAYPHKNLEFLIDAFVQFQKTMQTEIKLILVGKDDYFYKRLQEKVTKEEVDFVDFRHDISDETLFSLYSQAVAFISPSLMEGFGLPPLEAMSASCPVLVSDIPSFREVCEDVAFYFDPLAKDSLKQQMHLLYNLDQKTREQQTKKGLERVKDFSWETMAKETLKIYESSISIR